MVLQQHHHHNNSSNNNNNNNNNIIRQHVHKLATLINEKINCTKNEGDLMLEITSR
jgi:hypothetical protein